MRRTAMKRSAWAPRAQKTSHEPVEKVLSPTKPLTRPVAYADFLHDAIVAPIAKAAPVRSEAYRRVVASLPCCICGVVGYSQAAHGSQGKGMGIKACDMTLFPACCDRPGVRGCHGQLDQGAMFGQSVRRALEPALAADTRRKIQAMGLWPKGLDLMAEEE